MTTSELLDRLRRLDVRLWLENGKLKCSAPKNVLTAELQAAISASKPEIMELLRSGSPDVHGPAGGSDDGALSTAQMRIWFLTQIDPEGLAYNNGVGVRIRGPLDVAALSNAFRILVNRHESLRTVFPSSGGQPRAVVRPPGDFELPVIDATDTADDEERQLQLLRARIDQPYSIAEGPLFRPELIRIGPDHHVLLLEMHHMVSDGWSMNLLFQDLTAAYNALARGEEVLLPALKGSYRDYVRSERAYLEGPAYKETAAYWRERLANVPVLELPTDRPRPDMQTTRGSAVTALLSPELAERVKQIGRAHSTTPFVVLLAAYKALLARHSGQTDFAVGTPFANRDSENTDVIGLFINMLALRTDVSGDPTFSELIGRVRETSSGAMSHSGMPFERLLDVLSIPRSTRVPPVFQVMFNYHSYPFELPGIHGLEASPVTAPGGSSKFEITLELQETPDGLRLFFEYNTDLFDRVTAERMVRAYEILLDQVLSRPELPLSKIRLLDEAGRAEVLHMGRGADVTWDGPACAHDWFAARARMHPDAAAVSMGDRRMTYAELDARSSALARSLVARGVQRGTLVGICMERGPDMVAALLAVWKAGAAYLPLDPAFPADRLKFMAEDARLSLVLTQAPLRERVSGTFETVLLDHEDAWRDDARAELPRTDGGDLAYILYTSGSTGRPKGTLIEHRAFTNFLKSMEQCPGMRTGERLLSVTTLSFDIAGLELWLPLIVGGEVLLVSREVAAHGARLLEALETLKPDIFQATPVTWKMLIEAGWKGTPGLRALCGGEAMSRELARELTSRCARVWNMYGPTETTVWSTLAEITPQTDIITIGRPIANTQVYVLDGNVEPVPVGMSGELYIGGDGLARAYWNRPDLTAERFVPNPFGPGRLYRTGDLARFRSDGVLECLGRMDHQVKVRGYRIELGEIESRLLEHPAVRDAVVVAAGDGADRFLAAYMIRAGEATPAVSELRAHLSARLPDYMVPTAYVFMEAFPQTPNGKIDRKALPAPQTSAVEAGTEFRAAQSPTQAMLVEVLRGILKVDRIGVRDNFFDLGAHSLTLVRAHDAVSQRGGRISLIDFFQYPTVEALAARIDGAAAPARS